MTLAPFISNDGVLVDEPEDELWIRSGDNVQALAEDIEDFFISTGRIFAEEHLNLACIGAAAVNQAVKAVAVARQSFGERKLDLLVQPYFSNITDDQERKRTRMMLRVTVRAT